MPKMNQKDAKAAAKAASENPFKVLDDGYYKAKLIEVKAGKSKKSDPMWTWSFKVDGKKDLKEYTVMTDAALWKVGQIFEAFGVPTDTDTSKLVGKEITVEIGQEEFEGVKGTRTVNRIVGYPDQGVELGAFNAASVSDDDLKDDSDDDEDDSEPDF